MQPANRQILLFTAAGALAGLAAQWALGRRRRPDLLNHVVLITGGSRGLGLSLARTFAAEGCRVAICARDEGELERARQDLLTRGAEVFARRCDVSSREDVERLIDAVNEHYGRIDILVNNAGVIQVGPVENMTVDDFRQAMEVIFWGTVYPTLAVLPGWMERKSGRIVNITSIGGKVSVPHLLPYNCAKFAAVGFSEGLRAELAAYGIRVTTIAPGLMRTGSYLHAWFKGNYERESTWFGLAASLPVLSMNADRAARQILEATRRGKAEKILTPAARLLAQAHGLFPAATTTALGSVNRLILPKAQKGGSGEIRGAETRSLSQLPMTVLTAMGRKAAKKYLQDAQLQSAPAHKGV